MRSAIVNGWSLRSGRRSPGSRRRPAPSPRARPRPTAGRAPRSPTCVRALRPEPRERARRSRSRSPRSPAPAWRPDRQCRRQKPDVEREGREPVRVEPVRDGARPPSPRLQHTAPAERPGRARAPARMLLTARSGATLPTYDPHRFVHRRSEPQDGVQPRHLEHLTDGPRQAREHESAMARAQPLLGLHSARSPMLETYPTPVKSRIQCPPRRDPAARQNGRTPSPHRRQNRPASGRGAAPAVSRG